MSRSHHLGIKYKLTRSERNFNLKRLRRDLGPKVEELVRLPFTYTTDAEREELRAKVMGKWLRPSTETVTGYESLFKSVLLDLRIPALYEPIDLLVPKSSKYISWRYLPDFMLPFHYIEGKPIVIEPHDCDLINLNHLKKLEDIRKAYGIYLILATTLDFHLSSTSIDRTIQHVDELWFISKDSKVPLREKIKSTISESSYRSVCAIDMLLDKLRVIPHKNATQASRAATA